MRPETKLDLSLEKMEANPTKLLVSSYRSLLRAARPATRFSVRGTKNTRRWIRDEIHHHHHQVSIASTASSPPIASTSSIASSPSSPPISDLHTINEYKQRTLSLFLSSSWKRLFTNRLIANLSSLTYHHLSPYTRMQRLNKRVKNSATKPMSLNAMANIFKQLDSSEDLDETNPQIDLDPSKANVSQYTIPFLHPHPKPVRGPLKSKLNVWNGQNPNKFALSTELQADYTKLSRLIQSLPPGNKSLPMLQNEARQLGLKIKIAKKNQEKQAKMEEIKDIPIAILADLIATAQNNEKIYIGKARWRLHKNKQWLSP